MKRLSAFSVKFRTTDRWEMNPSKHPVEIRTVLAETSEDAIRFIIRSVSGKVEIEEVKEY